MALLKRAAALLLLLALAYAAYLAGRAGRAGAARPDLPPAEADALPTRLPAAAAFGAYESILAERAQRDAPLRSASVLPGGAQRLLPMSAWALQGAGASPGDADAARREILYFLRHQGTKER